MNKTLPFAALAFPRLRPSAVSAITRALSWLRLLLINMLIWALLSGLGAITKYSDALQQGVARASLPLFLDWWLSSAGFIALSFVLHLLIRRYPQLFSRSRHIAAGFLVLVFAYLPLELMYCAFLAVFQELGSANFLQCWAYLQTMHKFHWFSDFAIATGTYATMVAFSVRRHGLQLEQAFHRAQTENLNLQLQLEQQKLLAVRAQLEPHFIFNALNGISALVRMDDKRVALDGIQRLSHLLRYALTASAQEWVTLDQELAFLRDYLALQSLRYGARLHLALEKPEDWHAELACPPLLLQPLVENALRHGADTHTAACDLSVSLRKLPTQLLIEISNPMPANAQANPGLGLGLAQTRARLQLAYRGTAQLHTQSESGRFTLRLSLPLKTPL